MSENQQQQTFKHEAIIGGRRYTVYPDGTARRIQPITSSIPPNANIVLPCKWDKTKRIIILVLGCGVIAFITSPFIMRFLECLS